MSRGETRDPASLGRGPVTRWLPVLWQAEPSPPAAEPYPLDARTTTTRFLWRVLRSAPRLIIPGAIFAILWQVGEALVPVIAGIAIDQALATGDVARLLLWLVILAANFLVLSLSYRFASQLSARASELVQHRLRATLSRTVLHPSEGSGRSGPDGGVVSVMTNDVARIAQLGVMVFPIGELAGIVFIAVSLFVIHPILGIVALVGAPLTVWLMGVFSRRFARESRSYQTLLADTVGRASDLVAGYRVLKGIRAESEATRRYTEASRETLGGAYRLTGALGRFRAGSDAVSGVFVAAVAGLAGWLTISGDLTVGGLIAAVGLAQGLLPPMQMVTGNAIPILAAAHASSGRVLDLLRVDDAPGARGGTISEREDSTVPTVRIVAGQREIAEVLPGELVAIRAADEDAAKIARAVLHPRRSDGIDVHLDGVAAAALDDPAYRAAVVAAPHHGSLFTGTLAGNLGVTGASPEAQARSLVAAATDDVVAATCGVDGDIGEMGARLSGGQRQRLALARALATEAPVLVLHDPTTAVDSVTESTIAHNVRAIREQRTTILITSSPVLLAARDRTIDVREGSPS